MLISECYMSEQTNRQLAYDPQELECLLVTRENLGDIDGMAALYEPHALLDAGAGLGLQGREAIRKFFGELVATGQKFEMGEQRAPMVCGDIALTSTRLPDGTVTAEIARRQSDGTWLWVIDQFSISSETSPEPRDGPRK
jgi:ketosteroid isomerase-like protein